VRYKRNSLGVLVSTSVRNPVSIWIDHAFSQGYVSPPPSAADAGFRVLTEHQATAKDGSVMLRAVGEFGPARLGGYSGAGPGAPLASYRAPVLTETDARSRALLGGQPLLPDGNMAGYAQIPPFSTQRWRAPRRWRTRPVSKERRTSRPRRSGRCGSGSPDCAAGCAAS
jgi:hypothetical protein